MTESIVPISGATGRTGLSMNRYEIAKASARETQSSRIHGEPAGMNIKTQL